MVTGCYINSILEYGLRYGVVHQKSLNHVDNKMTLRTVAPIKQLLAKVKP